MVKPEHKGFPAAYPYAYTAPLPVAQEQKQVPPLSEDPMHDIVRAMARGRPDPAVKDQEAIDSLLQHDIDDSLIVLFVRQHDPHEPGLGFKGPEQITELRVDSGFSTRSNTEKDLIVIREAKKAKLGVLSASPSFGLVGYVYVDRQRMARVRRNFKPILIRR